MYSFVKELVVLLLIQICIIEKCHESANCDMKANEKMEVRKSGGS